MTPTYWLDPVRPGDLLLAVLEALAGDARVAVEGDAAAMESLQLEAIAGACVGPVPPFLREHGADSQMIVLLLENLKQARELHGHLALGSRVRAECGAIQIERRGEVQFVAGDSFHSECVSVGAGVQSELLAALVRDGAIRGFHSPVEAQARLKRRSE